MLAESVALFDFLMGEVRAYSVAGVAAGAALRRGDPEAAQSARAVAEIGCDTLERYLRNPFFRSQLTDEQHNEVVRAVQTLRSSLAPVDQCMT